MKRFFGSIVAFCLIANAAPSAEVDVMGQLRDKIMPQWDTIYRQSNYWKLCETLKSLAKFFPREAVCGQLVLRNLRQVGQRVQKLDPEKAPIPESAEYDTYLFKNCSSLERREKHTYNVSYQEGFTISTHDSITNTLGMNAGFTIDGVQFGLSSSQAVLAEKTQNYDQRKTVNKNIDFDELVPAMTALEIVVEKKASNDFYRFKGILNIEADVYVDPYGGGVEGEPQFFGKYSSFVPDNNFAIAGEIWNIKGTSFSKSYKETKLSQLDCDTAPVMKSDHVIASKAGNYFQPMATTYLQLPSAAVAIAANQVTESLSDGMTISTGDVIGNVEVRAKSFGPGYCAVTFSSTSGSTGFLAPPYSWSGWSVLTSSVGRNRIRISIDAKCDTGVLAEVRYWK